MLCTIWGTAYRYPWPGFSTATPNAYRDQRFSYGYRRFSLLGALINTIILIVGSILVLSKAVPRLIHPEHSNAQGMVAFAIIGILINGAAVLRLRGSKSLNARVIAWHLLEDVLGWVAVLIVAITLIFTDLHILDPLLSILISCYVLYNVGKKLRETLTLFLQGVPRDIDIASLEDEIADVKNVKSTHHTHIWSLDGEHHVLTTHVVVNGFLQKDQVICVKEDIKRLLKKYDLAHVTIEIEHNDTDCAMV
ncbi:MAG: cation diffusion facilitator family transporter [Chloroflexota bacterium]